MLTNMEHPIITHRLTNGIQLVMVPLANTAAVTTMVFMGVGSRFESPRQRGLAHFVEHMVFKGGNRYRTAKEVAQAMDSVGGEFNAYTNFEVTSFYTKTEGRHLELGLDVLSDMTLNAAFPSEELEKEKGVIVEEINMYEDMPMRKVYQVLSRLVYGETGLGLPIIGSKESVTSFTQADFLQYREQFYKGEKCTIAIAGAIDVDTTPALVERYFKELPPGGEYAPEKATYLGQTERLLIEYKQSEQTHLRLAVRSFPMGDPRRHVLGVMSTILGGNMSSRLFSSVREQQGLCYYVHSYNDSFTDTGMLVVSAGVDNNRLPQAVSAILKEMSLLRLQEVSEDELKRAKQYVLGKMSLNVEDSEHVAELYGLQQVLEHQIETIEEIRQGVEAVSAADIREVAEEIMQDAWLRLAVIGPHQHKEELTQLLTLPN